MKKIDLLITVASWEDRFLLGTEHLLKNKEISKILVFYYDDFAEMSKKNRHAVRQLSHEMSIEHQEVILSYRDYPDTWNLLFSQLKSEHINMINVLVDITTMPRFSIWSILYLLQKFGSEVYYVYHKPIKYSSDWLTRDPGIPKLVFKLSGISEFGKPTALIIVTGYDNERTEQLINFFEPKITFLGIQTGEQYENKKLNLLKHISTTKTFSDVNMFEIDSYAQDHGYRSIFRLIDDLKSDYNIVLTSIGPKPSAISCYKIVRDHPEIALAYAPSNDFNINYSSGLQSDGDIYKL